MQIFLSVHGSCVLSLNLRWRLICINPSLNLNIKLRFVSFSVSPYLKSLSMVAANKLLHLLEVTWSRVFYECFLLNESNLIFYSGCFFNWLA